MALKLRQYIAMWIPHEPVRIPAQRIILVGIDPAQAEQLAHGVCPFPCAPDYPHADTSTAARLMRRSVEVDNWVPGFGMYCIVRTEDSLVIGDIGFHAPPDLRGACEIGYGLAESARGHGFAREAVQAVTTWAHHHGCTTVLADVNPDNYPSIAVLEHCGFDQVRSSSPQLRYRHQAALS